jgi:hypothetical protein
MNSESNGGVEHSSQSSVCHRTELPATVRPSTKPTQTYMTQLQRPFIEPLQMRVGFEME